MAARASRNRSSAARLPPFPEPNWPGVAAAMAAATAGEAPEHGLTGSVKIRATLAARVGTLAFKAILLLRMVNRASALVRMVCGFLTVSPQSVSLSAYFPQHFGFMAATHRFPDENFRAGFGPEFHDGKPEPVPRAVDERRVIT